MGVRVGRRVSVGRGTGVSVGRGKGVSVARTTGLVGSASVELGLAPQALATKAMISRNQELFDFFIAFSLDTE
jgi:hypothetical protein